MSFFYTLAYRLGFTPWEHAATHPPAARHIAALFEREERERQAPYGRALDLGCGSGYWSVMLAGRGWEVTGVELVPKAVHRARERVATSGKSVRIVSGDICKLRDAAVGSDFRLVWDFGTIHGLTGEQQRKVGAEVGAVTTEDATVLLVAWAPARRGPLPGGMSRRDVEAAFEGWRITDEEPFDASGLPGPLRGADPRVYRLRRVSADR